MSKPLPATWIDRLFERFIVNFGSQKVGAMWAGVDVEVLKAEWATQLGRFPADAIGKALQSVVDSGVEWPPNLGQFASTCKAFVRPEQVAYNALPAPGSDLTDDETARKRIASIRIGDREGGPKLVSEGLPELLSLIAKAAGLAGSDPAKVLVNLERTYRQ